MWQRFTERARKVVFYAHEEAQHFGEGYVSTEHLLLGLLRDDASVAIKIIESLGKSRADIDKETRNQLPRGDSRPNQDMTLTPRAKRVIDLAYDEARNLNNNYIGTEHLLLGLIREGDGLAGRVLAKFGVSLGAARKSCIEIQAENPNYAQQQEGYARQNIPPNLEFQHKIILNRVRDWALWAHQLEDPTASFHSELDELKTRLDKVMSDMQQSLLLGLIAEVSEGGSLQENDNWKKLRLSTEQVTALAEIGTEVRKLLHDN